MAPIVAAALIGGGAGLAGNLVSGITGAYSASQERKAAERRRQQANQQISAWEQQANQILEEAARGQTSLSSPSDLAAYQALKASYDPSKYVFTDYEPFDKTKYNVEDYLNPQREAILSDIAAATQHTAAGAGLGHSSGALESIARNVLEKDESLYDKAYERMLGERSFDYGAYTDYINQKQNQLNALQQGVQTQMANFRGDIQFDQQQQDALLANRLNLGNALAQTRASLV
jgi:hypothetical protein